MIYNILEKTVYLKSRYELMALLENIQPAKGNSFEELLSSDSENLYEEKIDTDFPPNSILRRTACTLFAHSQ